MSTAASVIFWVLASLWVVGVTVFGVRSWRESAAASASAKRTVSTRFGIWTGASVASGLWLLNGAQEIQSWLSGNSVLAAAALLTVFDVLIGVLSGVVFRAFMLAQLSRDDRHGTPPEKRL